METDYETHTVFDINIRMPHSLMGYTDAWDYLSATEFFPQDEADEAQRQCDARGHSRPRGRPADERDRPARHRVTNLPPGLATRSGLP